MRTDRWRLGLASLFTLAGAAHFVVPKGFGTIVPPFLGPPFPYVYASGVAELSCAVGLLVRPAWVRERAGWASAALLVVVFPANVYMAVAAFTSPHGVGYRAGTLARLPLQIPLVWAAVAVALSERERARRVKAAGS